MKALTQEQPDKPCLANKGNFETLCKAIEAGRVCLMEVQIAATGERVAAICAINKDRDELEMVPFAVMVNGNPYELLNPPADSDSFVLPEKMKEEL
jgi:hypothetical protein